MSPSAPVEKIGVLFVCHGNICRSPLAEGIFRAHVLARGLGDRFVVDSAGVIDYHAGERPHRESIRVARDRGVDITDQRSRPFTAADVGHFHWILAMDRQNRKDISRIAPSFGRANVRMMLEFGDASIVDVPDPYYGGASGFDAVYDMLDRACAGLLDAILSDNPTGAPDHG